MDPLQVPPHNLEAEKSVLGSLLIDKDAIIKVADLIRAEDFYYEQNSIIYRGIMELFHRRSPIDLLTLASTLEDQGDLDKIGGRSYLAELTQAVITATHVVQYATIVKQKSTLRKLLKAGHNITALGFEEAKELEDLLETAEKEIFNITQNFIRDKFVHIKDILAQTYERIADLHDAEGKEKYRGTPTGFRSLDRVLSGLQPTDLLIVAARPAMGKTSFALNIAQNVAKQKKSVGIITLEMSKEQLVERMFCSLLSVDSWKLRTGRLAPEDFARMGAVMDELNGMKIFIDDSLSGSIGELRAKARRLQMEHGLDLLLIDYIQLMSVAGMGANLTNRVQEVSEISRSLKTLARELRIPIIALSQLSRAVENRPSKIPQLSDLRESGCLTGDTLITRADTGERVPIKELMGKTGVPVWSLGMNYQLEQKNISKVFSSGQKMTYELRTQSGRTIKASGNHPFLTINGWKAVEELKVGGHVAISRHAVNPNNDIIPDEAGLGWREVSQRINTAYCGSTLFKAGLSRQRMTRVAIALKSKPLMKIATADIYWDKLIEIRPLQIEEVFDATVPDNHNFLANDFIVHNSLEQDSDVVLMLYREDYYEEDTERAGITDIYIRKHRNGPTGRVELMFKKEQMRFYDIDKTHIQDESMEEVPLEV